jgi:predicted O-methyltransferase YrrM
MKWYVRELADLSPAKLWRLVSNPWKIQMALVARTASSNVDAVLSLFPNVPEASAEECRLEFVRNDKFFNELNKKMVEKRHRRTICGGWHEFLYMAVRFVKPQIVFETGVFDGESSSVILQALKDNGDGRLISVDLPATETVQGSTQRMLETTLPPDCQPGWAIPDYLKERHRLVFGDSRALLPQLLKEYSKTDIFFHDSLHTFEHQHFEYTTAWPYLTEGGLLLSDDILWSAAFHKFCREQHRTYVRLSGFGAVRK